MLSHADIWSAIDRLAAESGTSPSGLARRAGLDPTTFNRSKRLAAGGRPRWPSTESIAKILAATGRSLAEFASPGPPPGGRRLPLIPGDRAAAGGCFDARGLPAGEGWAEIEFPGIGDPHAYAMRFVDDARAPIYRAGDMVVLGPRSAARQGDRVVLGPRAGRARRGRPGAPRSAGRARPCRRPGRSARARRPRSAWRRHAGRRCPGTRSRPSPRRRAGPGRRSSRQRRRGRRGSGAGACRRAAARGWRTRRGCGPSRRGSSRSIRWRASAGARPPRGAWSG